MSRTSSLTRTTRCPRAVASGRRTMLGVPLLREGAVLGTINLSRKRVRAVHRAADRAGAHLCRPGGHRDGECAAARRIAGPHARPRRIARIPDRDQRCAQRHQPLDRRCATGAGHSGRNGRPALRRRYRNDFDTRGRGLPLCGERPARVEPEYWAILRQRTFVPGRDTVAGRAALEGRVVHVADIRADPDYADPRGCGVRAAHQPWGAAAARRGRARHDRSRPEAGRAVHRAADRTGAHLCRPGGHRDGECAAARRIAGPHARPRRIARIPDRDQRRAQRHQPLDRRCATGAGHSGRNRRPALRRRFRNDLHTRGRGLPLCVEFVQCSGPRVLGEPAPANHCPRSRQHRRAGGARRQGRACRGHPR